MSNQINLTSLFLSRSAFIISIKDSIKNLKSVDQISKNKNKDEDNKESLFIYLYKIYFLSLLI